MVMCYIFGMGGWIGHDVPALVTAEQEIGIDLRCIVAEEHTFSKGLPQ
jgi:hypothetical protein